MSVATIDTDTMTQLIRQVEQRAHYRGWDGPPGFYVLYDATEATTQAAYRMLARLSPPVRRGRYAAQEAIPAQALTPRPPHSLFRLALNLAYMPEHPYVAYVMQTLRQPGFLGAALVCEAWMHAYDTLEERARETRRLADVPGSIEQRSVWAHLADGTDLLCIRERGKKPVTDAIDHIEGSVIESLRLTVAVIAELPLPPAPCEPSGWSWS